MNVGRGFVHFAVANVAVVAGLVGIGFGRRCVATAMQALARVGEAIGTLPSWWRGWVLGALFSLTTVEAASWLDRPSRPRVLQGPSDVRLARDDEWAATLRQAWASDAVLSAHLRATRLSAAEGRPLVYECRGRQLHGTVFSNRLASPAGVVLYHTAAGPRDLFLYWKAQVLSAMGCTVLVADLYGDRLGQGWDPAFVAERRAELTPDVLRARSKAAVDALVELDADAGRLAAMGWCLGGRAVVELLKSGEDRLAAGVTFHGILDDDDVNESAWPKHTRLLALHGDRDPFVPKLEAFRDAMRRVHANFDLHVFAHAKHGFTNPGQVHNERVDFEYDQRAAKLAWTLAEAHLIDAFAATSSSLDKGGT